MSDGPPLAFVCPRCRGALQLDGATYVCANAPANVCAPCGSRYPVVSGIPDFRIAPDPWIDLEADREKGFRLERETAGWSFEAMVRAYWAMTPGTPPVLAARFTDHVCGAEPRAREWLDRTAAAARGASAGPWLDIGCGTADLAAAAGPGATVISIDIAFRWLVVARRRLLERGVTPHLVCCNAEALPFPDATFAQAVSLGTLEHCRDADAVMRDCARVLRPGAPLRLRTANRFSMLPEPHVGIWGVGWLPRRWADGYVRWRSGERYLHHWPKGAAEIRRALRRSGFVAMRVEAAAMLSADTGRLPAALHAVVPAYEALRTAPVVRRLLALAAPVLEASGRAGAPSTG